MGEWPLSLVGKLPGILVQVTIFMSVRWGLQEVPQNTQNISVTFMRLAMKKIVLVQLSEASRANILERKYMF